MEDENRIRRIAAEFDEALEARDAERAAEFFHPECEIELLGICLAGPEGARRFLEWMFDQLAEIRFEPITIMVEGNTFFEEFVLHGKSPKGSEVSSKQAEVLIFEDGKVRKLRLYFDRLEIATSLVRRFPEGLIVRKMVERSVDGLVE